MKQGGDMTFRDADEVREMTEASKARGAIKGLGVKMRKRTREEWVEEQRKAEDRGARLFVMSVEWREAFKERYRGDPVIERGLRELLT